MAEENESKKAFELTNKEKCFKSILEYFAKHVNYLCKKKKLTVDITDAPKFTEDELKIVNGQTLSDCPPFCDSGQGYLGEGIQNFMEWLLFKDEKNTKNSFSCLGDNDQKICISVHGQSSKGGGIYLHLVTKEDPSTESASDKNNESQTRSKGTNINLSLDNNIIIGVEAGPHQREGATYSFPVLPFTFDELGLSTKEDEMNNMQKHNLHTLYEYFIEMRKQELMGSLTYRGMNQLVATHNMILTGAPGTGKTWSAKNIASWMICGMPYEELTRKEFKNKNKTIIDDFEKHCKIVQFHPSYDYTDFVEGLRPTTTDKKTGVEDSSGNTNHQNTGQDDPDPIYKTIGFERVDGVFKEFCKTAAETENPNKTPFIFIIDEINRGELSKIFGELFYSIDPGYRGEDGKVFTQYQNMVPDNDTFSKEKGGFYVPENVYVIGTMNDIDRSVESMDFAMRRRFSFIEVKANQRIDMWCGEKDKKWADLAKACMEAINKKIEDLPGLSSAYHIGPAYFKKLNDYMEQQGDNYPDFFKLWDNHLYGVIFEYLRGKKDAEKMMIDIQNTYLKALVDAVNNRFSLKQDEWGGILKNKLWDKADTIDASIKVFPTDESFTKFKERLNEPKDIDSIINDLCSELFETPYDELKGDNVDEEKENSVKKKITSYNVLIKLKNSLEKPSPSTTEDTPEKLLKKLFKIKSQENIKKYLKCLEIKLLDLITQYQKEQKQKEQQENAQDKLEQESQDSVNETASVSSKILRLSNYIKYLLSIGAKINESLSDASNDEDDNDEDDNDEDE